jgi:hypothetical protein
MTWFWVILIVAAIGGLIGFLSSGNQKMQFQEQLVQVLAVGI